jgi:septum formation inhibitor MinC
MTDTTNTPQIDIVYESTSETTLKSKRLNYEKIKELCTEAQYLRVELNKSQSKEIRARLDTFLQELHKLRKSTSKHLDSDEVMSDVAWITQYIKADEWNNVTRWLSNIDSSLREMWSHYMDSINKSKNVEES